jgi:hypothetical protein
MVYKTGSWGGETAPEIIESGPFYSGETLLATYYNISPEGYVLVPVLKEMQPVKAYSEKGYFDPTEENGFVQLMREVLAQYFQLYLTRYSSLETPQPEAGEVLFDRRQKSAWERLAVPAKGFVIDQSLGALAGKGPLMMTTWDQREPYNNLCPMGDGGQTVVGCVATASAQIMAYWQWPPRGYGSEIYAWMGDISCSGSSTYQELFVDYSDDYDWANMPLLCEIGCTAEELAAVSELNYEVAVAFHTKFGYCSSCAPLSRIYDVVTGNFAYRPGIQYWERLNYTLEEWFTILQAEINADRVIVYTINLHALVADGWRDQGAGWYEYHMNYGWGGAHNAWYVFDNLYCYWMPGEICPSWEDEMYTHIHPQTEPIMALVGKAVDDSGGDNDGHAEAGESVELSLTVYNSGWDTPVTTGVLSSGDSYVTVTTDTADFDPNIRWNCQGQTQTPFVFEVAPDCPDPCVVQFDLEIFCGSAYSTNDSFYVFVGDVSGFEDDTESGQGFWTHKPQTNDYTDGWHLSSDRNYSGSTSWKAQSAGPDDGFYKFDGGLMTPPFLLPGNAELSFWHWLQARIFKDGALVYISVDDGPWTIITPVGGYPRYISDTGGNPIEEGTPCYSGSISWSQTIFDLSDYSGVARLMFRFASDMWVEYEGWYIDDIEVYSVGCCGLYTSDQTGNCNCSADGARTLSDISRLIDHVYISKDPLCCIQEGNTNGDIDGNITLADITRLIDHVFISKEETAPCQ